MRCFKFPIQPHCTFTWIFPYGPFTAANQCGTQIVIKVGAERGALGSFWLQDLGNWLRFHTAAGRNFLPAAVWRTRANLEWPVATKRSLLTAMMREKNNDTWSSRNFFSSTIFFFFWNQVLWLLLVTSTEQQERMSVCLYFCALSSSQR